MGFVEPGLTILAKTITMLVPAVKEEGTQLVNL